MAQRDKQFQPGIQPPEDYYGRTEEPRRPTPEQETNERERDAADTEEQESTRHMRTIDPAERTPGAILDEIGDGDGPRSDAGTNPLPETYWSAYPEGEPSRG